MEKLNSVEMLFDKAGGTVKVASFLNMHQHTVGRWANTGIPSIHWGKLSKRYDVSIEDLYYIMEKIRFAHKRKRGLL